MYVWLLKLFSFLLAVKPWYLYEEVLSVERQIFNCRHGKKKKAKTGRIRRTRTRTRTTTRTEAQPRAPQKEWNTWYGHGCIQGHLDIRVLFKRWHLLKRHLKLKLQISKHHQQQKNWTFEVSMRLNREPLCFICCFFFLWFLWIKWKKKKLNKLPKAFREHVLK